MRTAEMTMPALRKTVLLVEDDETIRELIGMHLLGAGYAVRSVADGLEALRACLKYIPDLVISDVRMPRMGGSSLSSRCAKTNAQRTSR